ncbi:3'(2'),5'-bisphosphate nucleotidase [Exophiala aquamarina CBS 119918]|uniref:3'(2'),5'-bisphosphate nucleotidase n=1 Tax=Exophiala aquamarina CBS 119918 TaxID=1182545 RepID=A0A072PJA5_9EURO|nr:3'(2'),5'-bisphosphate nucleotidase [Exophiala aquamarina CBS 119918]KEF59971.1 3'(2'),5'-bisphosphate nucleotidase [Exophiala aquamarina CBS 119918]
MPLSYAEELEAALRAVHLASHATKSLLPSQDKGSTWKSDHSPVTVADYASQALLIATVAHSFPNDHFLGEESAAELRRSPLLAEQVWDLVSETLRQSPHPEAAALLRDELKGVDDVFRYIDMGGEGMGGPDSGRLWVLDPLDGTAAFLKGTQYALSLALLQNGTQQVGVVGCPNLPFDAAVSPSEFAEVSENLVDTDGHGCILSAVKGCGAFVRKMGAKDYLGPPTRVAIIESNDTGIAKRIRLVQPSNKSYDAEKLQEFARQVGAPWPGTQLWSSQMRFAALAISAGNVQVAFRIPRDYHSCVWDVAGGALVVEEAGGKVTDANGKELDFTRGRRLDNNWGIVAAPAAIHPRMLKVARAVDEGG